MVDNKIYNDLSNTNITDIQLISEEDFIKQNENHLSIMYTLGDWSEPKYRCPRCGKGKVRMQLGVVYTSNPPCYKYACDTCDYNTYHNY